MHTTRALFFDVFGTLVDWRGSLIDEAAGLGSCAGTDWAAVVDDWRRAYQPALDRVRAGQPWRDLDSLHHDTLAEALRRHDVALPLGDRESLVRAWRRLRPWPDTRAGLDRLRLMFRTATLSNGHMALLVDLFRVANLRVDAILSSQLVGSYKPDPQVYARAVELLGCRPGQGAMVAAHAEDLIAASEIGMRPIFVRRPHEWGPAGGEEPPAGLPDLVVADDLLHLAKILGC